MRTITHHFLFQGRHYNTGWAKRLRDDRYCGAYINQRFLHRDIHSVCHDVPCPSGAICRKVYQELCRQREAGFISNNDPAWVKLEWLAEQFEDECPITASILRWQRSKIIKFYRKEES